MLFSIIIPVFNVESYIDECIASCLNQGCQDFEIIIVDDCGADRSLKIIEEFASDKIKIIKNPHNMGLFLSRRIGERASRGEYLLHLDGDDRLEMGILETLKMLLETTKRDVIGFQAKAFPCNRPLAKMPIGNELGKRIEHFFMWGKIYRRDLVMLAHDKIRWEAMRYHPNNAEDVYMNLFLYSLAKDYCGIASLGYFYRIRRDSITQQNSWKKVEDIEFFLSCIKNSREVDDLEYKFLASKILESAYWIEQRHLKNYFLCCLKAFCSFPRVKTLLRLLCFICSFGFMRL